MRSRVESTACDARAATEKGAGVSRVSRRRPRVHRPHGRTCGNLAFHRVGWIELAHASRSLTRDRHRRRVIRCAPFLRRVSRRSRRRCCFPWLLVMFGLLLQPAVLLYDRWHHDRRGNRGLPSRRNEHGRRCDDVHLRRAPSRGDPAHRHLSRRGRLGHQLVALPGGNGKRDHRKPRPAPAVFRAYSPASRARWEMTERSCSASTSIARPYPIGSANRAIAHRAGLEHGNEYSHALHAGRRGIHHAGRGSGAPRRMRARIRVHEGHHRRVTIRPDPIRG